MKVFGEPSDPALATAAAAPPAPLRCVRFFFRLAMLVERKLQRPKGQKEMGRRLFEPSKSLPDNTTRMSHLASEYLQAEADLKKAHVSTVNVSVDTSLSFEFRIVK